MVPGLLLRSSEVRKFGASRLQDFKASRLQGTDLSFRASRLQAVCGTSLPDLSFLLLAYISLIFNLLLWNSDEFVLLHSPTINKTKKARTQSRSRRRNLQPMRK